MEERMGIVSASPDGNNFDSCSIRYASETLRKRAERHKFRCVILDGIYACGTGKFRETYGKDYFINTACPDDLADQAACLIKTLVKGC